MKAKFFIITITFLIFGTYSCTENWEDHYGDYQETVDQNVWDAMQNTPEISEFVQVIKQFNLDTLFSSDNAYTIFVPSNSAMEQYLGENVMDTLILKYHMSAHFLQSGNITGIKKVQTLSRKFAFFEKSGNGIKFDGISIESESPLFLNGKYFVMEQVAQPLLNLYQYYVLNNPILGDYIDSQDSIILDREKSKPIGFDEDGNTVYDTVSVIYNKFEAEYFPVKQEFRNTNATIVFPVQENYHEALDVVAQNLGIQGFVDNTDIPLDWQNEVLIPHILKQGLFENLIEPDEFIWKSPKDTVKLKNVLGDSIPIFYIPVEKTMLSNGYAYNYSNFVIPDSLFLGRSRYEGEWLLSRTGVNSYAWSPKVTVTTSPFSPVRDFINTASNDSIVRVLFPKGYTGNYSLEFRSQKLFPRKHLMVVRTHMDIGGIYDIYVNDELVKTFNSYQEFRRGFVTSVTGERYFPVGRFNRFDLYVDNFNEYGRAKIRFEYKGPGFAPTNGLVLDYIDFIPVVD